MQPANSSSPSRNPARSAAATRWPLLLLPLAAFIATVPLLLHGASCGHDFDFHILNWLEVAAQWKQGIPYPHWAVTPAFGAGEPRFVFYPPLSWALGALLSLILPLNSVPAAYTCIALAAAGFSLYTLAREWVPERTAVLAGIVYTLNPYMLFTAYERTAYAELLAATWMPLLLLAVLRRRPTIQDVAIPIALLWLTNAPAAVMGCYALALLAVVRFVLMLKTMRNAHARSEQPWRKNNQDLPPQRPLVFAVTIFAGTVLGLALAAVYVVPAAYEQRWVQINMATIIGMRIQDGFLFGHTPDPAHDAVLWTASCIAVMLFLITAAATWFARPFGRIAPSAKHEATGEPSTYSQVPVIALGILALFIALLLLPVSLPVWKHLPELGFLQFPWRWLAVLSAAMALLVSFALRPIKPRILLTLALLLPLLLVPASSAYFQQVCDRDDTPTAQLATFKSSKGVAPTDEYTPSAADNDKLKVEIPKYWLGASPGDNWPQFDVAGDPHAAEWNRLLRGALQSNGQSAEHWPITAHADRSEFLILRLRDYPAWKITVNGHLISSHTDRDDGLMAIPIPAGESQVDIRYVATPDRRIGQGISAMALLILLLITVMPRFTPVTPTQL